jgi:hypothetical protein
MFWSALILWKAPLSELHDFRQSQTALSAYWMTREGPDLLRPPLPVFGTEHPSAPFEFPLYQALIAATDRALGVESRQAILVTGRIINFVCFLLTGWGLFRLIRLIQDAAVAHATTLLFLFLPYPVFWSTSVLIEFPALAATVFFMEALWRVTVRNEVNFATVGGGLFAGTVAMLVKITTPLIYGPSIFAFWLPWIIRARREGGLKKAAALTLVLAVLPLAAGVIWTWWSDTIKATSPVTYFLTSAGNAQWNYGTLAQRLSPLVWARIFGFWLLQILAVVGLPFVLTGIASLWRRDRYSLLIWCLIPVSATLTFTNLYQRHNYYSIALLPPFMALLGTGVIAVGRHPFISLSAGLRTNLLCGAIIVLSWLAFVGAAEGFGVHSAANFLAPFRGANIPASDVRKRDLLMTSLISAHSKSASDVVLIINGDWKPVVPFLTERKALMPQHCARDLSDRPRFDLIVKDDLTGACPDIRIPPECALESRDGITVGHCIEAGGRRLPVINTRDNQMHSRSWDRTKRRR